MRGSQACSPGEASRLPSASSTQAKTKLLPDVLKPPFSFVYGDRPSADLLPAWKCEVKSSEVDDMRQQEVTYTNPKSGLGVRSSSSWRAGSTTQPLGRRTALSMSSAAGSTINTIPC